MQTNKFNLWIKKVLGNNVKKALIWFLFPQRNQFMLFNYSNRARKHRVNLNYWLESENLGDTLSPIIVDYMLSLRGISKDAVVAERRHLYAVGSVLTAGIQDCTVWGSGILNATLTYRLDKRKFDIRAVRGPLTRVILIDYGYNCPDVFGDPAILLPEIYTPASIEKKFKFGLIMHKDQIFEYESNPDIIPINICTADFHDFVDQLNSVEMVISSSLHGIILAESYGIKAVLLKPKVDILKYYDWYYSTRRYSFPIAACVDEAVNTQPVELPDLDELRRSLKEVFPYDIYQ